MKTSPRPIALLTWLLLPGLPAAAQVAPTAAPVADLGDLSLEQLMEVRIDKVSGAANHAQDVLPQPGRSVRLKATYRF